MSRTIQIQNVPDEVYRQLKARAAKQGMSLSEMLLREAVRLSEMPTVAEVLERIRSRPSVTPSESIVDIIRAHRDAS